MKSRSEPNSNDLSAIISQLELLDAEKQKLRDQLAAWINENMPAGSLREVGEMLGVSYQYIRLIKSGTNSKDSPIKTETLIEIAKKIQRL